MKAYKIECLVIDHEDLGIDGIKTYFSNMRWVNPIILETKESDIGEWSDDHPLNKPYFMRAEVARLFGENK